MCSAESWGFRFTKLSLTGEYHARQREFAAEFGPCQGRWDLRESKDRSVLSEVFFLSSSEASQFPSDTTECIVGLNHLPVGYVLLFLISLTS